MSFLDNLPKHVALTLDGNRRWAVKHGEHPKMGIWHGIKKTKEVIFDWTSRFEEDFGVQPFKELTCYALTLNNVEKRTKEEIKEISDAFLWLADDMKQTQILTKRNMRAIFGGRLELLTPELQIALDDLQSSTKSNTKYFFNAGMVYDGTDEIDRSVRKIIEIAKSKPAASLGDFKECLDFPKALPVDLWIRTGGEQRLSGFMNYYIGYSELFFLDCLAEDFTYSDFIDILQKYSKRDRRFGK
jgi:undecaprenyl diphosphate synthase